MAAAVLDLPPLRIRAMYFSLVNEIIELQTNVGPRPLLLLVDVKFPGASGIFYSRFLVFVSYFVFHEVFGIFTPTTFFQTQSAL